jgi:outer membrane protein OmpA-like peptidoglycan-associated protein
MLPAELQSRGPIERALALSVGVALLLLPTILVMVWINSAEGRLQQSEQAEKEHPQQVAVAKEANESYCTPELKQILRRVLASCGLIGASGGRGCQPLEAKNVATMSGADFNALFLPMKERGGIVQFDLNSAALDTSDNALVDKVFADRAGASYFFVVSRASQDGSTEKNRQLSQDRANAVMQHLSGTFQDPDLDKQVGLLWLGEEYAQLDPSFCQWSRSGTADQCLPEDLNRSAFLAWIDCRL